MRRLLSCRVLAPCLGLIAGPGFAACLPLPTAELRALDAQTEPAPDAAVAAVTERLSAPGGHTEPLIDAGLYAVLADARGQQSRVEAADAAASAGLRRLEGSSPTPDGARLRLRLELLRAELKIMQSDGPTAVTRVTQLLTGLANTSLEHACALSVRAMAYDHLNQPDRAVADALDAYRLADENHWDDAVIETSYSLARNFRRAGLYDRAEAMIDTMIKVATATHAMSSLATAEYERGQMLLSTHRYAEARAALEKSKLDSLRIDDRFGAAAAAVPLCAALVEQHELTAADAACAGNDVDLAAGQRSDLSALLQGYRARLTLAHDRPAAALAQFNALLTTALHELLPAQEAGFYRDRAAALGRLGRFREAYADLTRARELDVESDSVQRTERVDILAAVTAADELTVVNRSLRQRVLHDQADLERQRQARQLWTSIAAGAVGLSVMFGYLFMVDRRHARALRRHQIILASAGGCAPDALVLLDDRRLVRFANRNLCGFGLLHAVGAPLGPEVPASLAAVLDAALDEALRTRSAVNASAAISGPAGETRQLDLCVVPALDGDDALGFTIRSNDVTDARLLEREAFDETVITRQRTSLELHEGIGQQLAGVLLLLGNLSKVIRRGRVGADQLLAEIADYVSQSIEAARDLARGLAPVKVGRGSLGVALRSLVAEARLKLGIEVRLDLDPAGESLSELAADHIYQICQDAVRYAAVRSGCARVAIGVRCLAGSLVLELTDDGCAAGPTGDDFEVKMIAYRARLLAGSLRMIATPGARSITVSIPMSHVRHEGA